MDLDRSEPFPSDWRLDSERLERRIRSPVVEVRDRDPHWSKPLSTTFSMERWWDPWRLGSLTSVGEVHERDLGRRERLPTTLFSDWRLDSESLESRSSVGEVAHLPRLCDRFEWTVHDVFNAFDEKQLESPGFGSDGALWRMRIIPMRTLDDVDSYIDLQLCRSPPSPGARYQVRIGVKKANGRDSQKVSYETDFDRYLQVHKLLQWRSTISSRFVSDGRLTIFCELSPSGKGSEALPKMTTPVESDTSLLIENLRDLYASGANSDVELNVGGKVFKAHKAIVCARCPVFSSMFQHDMRENSSGVVEIPDCSADAFSVFLRYLYTGEMGEVADQKLVCNLYYIADKYNVQELQGFCSALLTDELSVGNFCDVYSLALRYSESALLKSVCEFFTQNVKAIITTARWQTYLTENPIHANELFIQSIDAQSSKKDLRKP